MMGDDNMMNDTGMSEEQQETDEMNHQRDQTMSNTKNPTKGTNFFTWKQGFV